MNKLLTTIILLCFSVAANADIYTCTTKADALVSHPGNNGPNYLAFGDVEEDGSGYVVDTDRGMRSIPSVLISSRLDQETLRGLNEEYYGSCTIYSNQITCQNSPPGGFSLLIINTSELPYKFSSSDTFSSGGSSLKVGTCIKI